MARVIGLPGPPAAGAIWISFTWLGSPSRGYQKTIWLPSGEKDGMLSKAGRPVSARTAPLATSSTMTDVRSESPKCGRSWRTSAIDLPSGDQERGDEGDDGGSLDGRLQVPLVSRLASPPSAGISQTCDGRAA